MQKNDKGQVIIHSINELPLDEKKMVRLGAIGGGALVLAIYFPVLLLLGVGPSRQDPLFASCIDLGLVLAWAIGLGSQGVYWGRRLMAANLGYAFPARRQIWGDSSYQHPSFSSSEDVHYASASRYESHMSINPSSGLPMSGSSGIDIRGNPYGSSSW